MRRDSQLRTVRCDPDDVTAILLTNECRHEIYRLYGLDKPGDIMDLRAFTDSGGFFLVSSPYAVACGGVIPMEEGVGEIKSVYVVPAMRGQGFGFGIVKAIEDTASRFKFHTLRLETGVKQVAAKHIYEASGYQRIPNYGDHAGRDDQFCYEKRLS